MARKQKTGAKRPAKKAESEPASQNQSKGTSFPFGDNTPLPADAFKRYPKKIYDLQDLPIKHYKTFRNVARELRDNADKLDRELLPPGGKLAVRIERSSNAEGKGRKYNSSRKIFDSFAEIAHYLQASNSIDTRNTELINHIQILTFRNQYNSQVWQADENIKAAKRMLKRAQKKERQIALERAKTGTIKELRAKLEASETARKKAEKTLAEALTVERSRRFFAKKKQAAILETRKHERLSEPRLRHR